MESPGNTSVLVTVLGAAILAAAFWGAWSRERFERWYGPLHRRRPTWGRRRRGDEVVPMLDPVGDATSLESERRGLLVLAGSMLLLLTVAVVSSFL